MSKVTYPVGEVNKEKSATPRPLTRAVREFRRALGDTQQSFAARLGLAISTVVRYESTRAPGGAALAQLAKAAGENGLDNYGQEFMGALAKELGLAEIIGSLFVQCLDDGTVRGLLMLPLEGPDQYSFANAFFDAFTVYARSSDLDAKARAEALLRGFQDAVRQDSGPK